MSHQLPSRSDIYMRELVDKLNRTAYEYYTLDNPTISDKEWDKMYDELVELEKKLGKQLPDSPTRRVGGDILPGFKPHVHISRLLSMSKAQSFDLLKDWIDRSEKLRLSANEVGANLPPLSYIVEYKFDGLTINLTYKDGQLTNAATRGNGITGEDILQQALTIKSIPLSIPFKGTMEIHGEAIMRKSVLEELNKTSSEPLKNPRNAAAGAIRNLDPKVTASRKLDVYFYDIGFIEGKVFSNQSEMIRFMKDNHFKVSDCELEAKNYGEVTKAIDAIKKIRDKLDFDIDGAVVKIKDFATRAIMGSTDKFPRWAIAYKFEAEEVTTTLEKVVWQVGRTGKLTPVAEVTPVELAGVTVKKATLNNWNDIRRKRVKLGCKVWIRRSNDVIPEITSRVDEVSPKERDIAKPLLCPECGSTLVERGAVIFCPNRFGCNLQIVMRISHFAGREAMDIDGLSDKTAAILVNNGLVKEVNQLYDISFDELRVIDRFGEKKAASLIEQIEKSKKCKLSNFIFALGIPNVGVKTARDLANKFGDIDSLIKANREDLMSIPDIGQTVADSILDFFEDRVNLRVINSLISHGVDPEWNTNPTKGIFAGKSIVVTGTLQTMSRKGIEAIIFDNGGKVSSSVSRNTSFVVAGENAGSKLKQAESLGIKIINEEEFKEMIT